MKKYDKIDFKKISHTIKEKPEKYMLEIRLAKSIISKVKNNHPNIINYIVSRIIEYRLTQNQIIELIDEVVELQDAEKDNVESDEMS